MGPWTKVGIGVGAVVVVATVVTLLFIFVFNVDSTVDSTVDSDDRQIFVPQTYTDGRKHIYEFWPTTPISEIKLGFSRVVADQGGADSQWAMSGSYLFIFHPGMYDFGGYEIQVPFQTSVRGLGKLPKDTIFKNVNIITPQQQKPVTNIFWRDVENISLSSGVDNIVKWSTSPECVIRRVETDGDIWLDPDAPDAWSSGGFISNVKARKIIAHHQQQFCMKSVKADEVKSTSMNWVYINCDVNKIDMCQGNTSPGTASVVNNIPNAYDKPFLINNGNIRVPRAATKSAGYDVDGEFTDVSMTFMAYPTTPISKNNNILYSMGWPIIDNKNNNGPAINVTGSNCIIAGGMLVDAGFSNVDALISISSGTGARMYDVCCRVLRPNVDINQCKTMISIQQNNTYSENLWLWVADHQIDGKASSEEMWNKMRCETGLIVTGLNARIVGLAVEHQYGVMVKWDGNDGECYFFQSEFAYGGKITNGSAYVVTAENHILRGGGAYFVVDCGFDMGTPDITYAFKTKSTNNIGPVIFNGPFWPNFKEYVKSTIQYGDKTYPQSQWMVCKAKNE